jgi:predicted Rossmann fold flavoprotein
MGNKKVLMVVGGGAAGFFCAINAAEMNPDLEVVILEKSNKVLSKVKISGGGRCNVTHSCFDISDLIQYYPRGGQFLKKCFHWFNPQHTIQWFKLRKVHLVAEPDGRMFSSTNTSETIINCFLNEAKKYNIRIILNKNITSIISANQLFKLTTHTSETFEANYVCITTGGFPKPEQWNWIAALGHTIIPPVPSLFTFNMHKHVIQQFSGIAIQNVCVRIANTKLEQTGALLITHFGFSGPAILKLSAWGARWLAENNYHFNININWISNETEHTIRSSLQSYRSTNPKQSIGTRCMYNFPERLWHYFLTAVQINPHTKWADISNQQINQLIKKLLYDTYLIQGKTTFKDEFVTAGGVQLNEVNANTMESKKIPGLYFAGEVLDIDGVTGGFNFQNAWTTAFIAASAIAKSSRQ